jgi:TRAP-type C4-dicarboxylate transport system substrate-binding protein
MGKKGTLFLMIVVLSVMVAMISFTEPALSQQKVIKWKGQTCFPSTVAPYGPFAQGQTGLFSGIKQWSDWLYNRTNGRLAIDWAEPGAIFPITETDKGVAQGVVQISYEYGGYYAGRIPETDIETGGVFFYEDESQYYECLYKYGLFQAMQKAYAKYNLYWLPLHNDAIVGMGTIFPAPTPQSVKGKKLRTVGIWGDYVSLLGGIPVSIPWGDVYMGAKLGTVDGWVAGIASMEELKLKEVTKGYVIHPLIGTASSGVIINKAAYSALPKDIQDILQNEAPHWSYFTSTHWHNQCMWIARNAKEEYGVKLYYWSPEDIDSVTKLVVEKIFPKIASKSPDSARMLEMVKKQMRDYGRIK